MGDITWHDVDGATSTSWDTGQTHGVLHAGPHTDYFVDPRGIDPPTANAPLLLTDPGAGPFQFTALLRAQNVATFDGGQTWSLRRLFTLGDTTGHRVGFAIQSPTGDGLTATVAGTSLIAAELKNVRDGS